MFVSLSGSFLFELDVFFYSFLSAEGEREGEEFVHAIAAAHQAQQSVDQLCPV
jgi:hypothetical protein